MVNVTVQIGGESRDYSTKKAMLKEVSKLILSNSEQAMTLRQLYYQLVGRDLIDNKVSQYQYLSESITEARVEGSIPWEWIEDRTRAIDAGDHNDGRYVSAEARFRGNIGWFDETPDRFHRPRWMGQQNYVEVWVEKQALSGIFADVCDDLGVVTYPNSGYSSITLLKEAADRIETNIMRGQAGGKPKEAHICYFGDYDPSGVDIERNIREKLQDTFGVDVDVHRVALTADQIDEFELPPQPAKRTDARYEDFVAEHGDMAVELDALPVEELRSLIRDSVDDLFDDDYYEDYVEEKQAEDREQLREWIDDVLVEDEAEEWL